MSKKETATIITASEKFLSFEGLVGDAIHFVDNVRGTYNRAGEDMPKVLNDFIFNIEVELQHSGVLDKDFNEVKKITNKVMYEYLIHVRDSGKINMAGAAKILEHKFGLDRHDAKDVLLAWVKWCKGEVQNES